MKEQKLLTELSTYLEACRAHNPHFRDFVYDKETNVYFPPGLYYESPNGPGHPIGFYLPVPHHPLEVLVAVRADAIAGPTPVTAEELYKSALLLRGYENWIACMDAYSKILDWPKEWTRFAFHLLTPLVVNGGGADRDDMIDWRGQLYTAAGLGTRADVDCFALAAKAQDTKDGPPGGDMRRKYRTEFWGKEVHWPLQLS